MTYSLDIDFKKPKKGEFPGPPRAGIYVKTFTSDDSGRLFITPQDNVSLGDLEHEIERLHKELEDIRKKAKSKFKNKDK